MVVEKFGEEAWKDLANKSSLPYTFETDAHFNDDLIYELLKHASEVHFLQLTNNLFSINSTIKLKKNANIQYNYFNLFN